MKITKNQLKQIIKEELQAVLNEAEPPWVPAESVGDLFNKVAPDPEKWTYLDPADKPPDPFKDINAKKKTKKAVAKKVAKKGLFSGLGKFLARVASGPVGAAITGAEAAGHLIDMGVGGDRAKYGKAQYGFGSEEAAYNLWTADTLKKTGKKSPSYEQFLDIESGAKTEEQVKAEMDNPSELKFNTSEDPEWWPHS